MFSIKKVLSKETPLMFLWMVKDSEKLENNNPIPNHEKLPYIDRLYKWAQERNIILLYVPFDSNGIDLNEEQIQKFYDLASPEKGGRKNIEVIDLYSSFKDKYDLSFLKDKDMHFACKVDLARIIALLKLGPAIYFDFDVTPIEGRKLGEVPMNTHGFAMAKKPLQDSLENSIIAVDSKDNYILRALYKTIDTLSKSEKYNDHDDIWRMQVHAVKLVHAFEQEGMVFTADELNSKLEDSYLKSDIENEDMIKIMLKVSDVSMALPFMFKGPAHIGADKSWELDDISSKEVMACIEKLEGLKANGSIPESIDPAAVVKMMKSQGVPNSQLGACISAALHDVKESSHEL